MPIEFDLNMIVHHERDLSSGYHLMVARGWRIIGEKDSLHSPLAYSAFEFRCAIERVLIELFVLVKDKMPTKADIHTMNTVSSLRKAIYRACGGKTEFKRFQIFNRLFVQGSGLPPNVSVAMVDIDYLERLWSKLSDFCHRQLRPHETWKSQGDRWLKKGYQMLNEAERYLWSIMVTSHIGWVQPSELQPEMREALDQFVGGEITQRTLETRLNLMGPIIKKRLHGRY